MITMWNGQNLTLVAAESLQSSSFESLLHRVVKSTGVTALVFERAGPLTCCRLCARAVSTAQGGSAWQAGVAEGGEEGSWPGGGRVAGEEMAEVEGEEGAPLKALPSARSGA